MAEGPDTFDEAAEQARLGYVPVTERVGCVCPTRDPVDCVQVRYKMPREDALIERCECACHEEWEAELREINEALDD